MLTLTQGDAEEEEDEDVEVGDGSQRLDKKILTFKVMIFD
jgi:hypothetical protein